jgi:hypothetical protein
VSAFPDAGPVPDYPPADMAPGAENGPMEPQRSEVDLREYTEVCLLDAIETCAKGVSAGVGASNPEYAGKFAQAAASLGQAYQYVASVEQQKNELDQKTAEAEMKAQAAVVPPPPRKKITIKRDADGNAAEFVSEEEVHEQV